MPDVWSCPEFLHNCGVGVPGSVSSIRDALETYHGPGGDKVTQLFIIWKECKDWRKKREKKKIWSKGQQRKEAAIASLQHQVGQALGPYGDALERYDQRKQDVGAKQVTGGFKPLESGYDLERRTYLKGGKKITPFSATVMSANAYGADLIKKKGGLGRVTPKDFERVGQQRNIMRMYFCNKRERMRLLVEYVGATWVDVQGEEISTQMEDARLGIGHPNECQMWAMDRYGNLFVTYDNLAYGIKVLQATKGPEARAAELRGGMMNHSSFCAGRDIICAGMIFFWKGQLIHIDNNSGHYKPTKQNLRNAVRIIVNDVYGGSDYRSNYLRVGVKTQQGGFDLYTASHFLISDHPDWNPQDAGTDHTAIYRAKPGFQY